LLCHYARRTDLPSFPTRRSSDLSTAPPRPSSRRPRAAITTVPTRPGRVDWPKMRPWPGSCGPGPKRRWAPGREAILGACDLGDRVPGAGRHVLAEGLLDQRHEDGPLGARQVGAEHLPPLDRQDARAVPLDRQAERGRRLGAQERDDAFGFGIEAK